MSAAVKICGLEEWAREVTSGSSIAVGGFGFSGVPFELLGRIAAEGEAQRLTLVTASCSGEDCGIGSLIARGMVDKVISAFVAENRVFSEAFHDGCFCLELCPMGTLVDRLTAGGTGIKAFYTTTGVGTVLVNGGVPQRYSSVDKGVVTEFSQPRETRLIDGEWCCMDTALKTDVALIKAWKGDKHGNLIFHATARNFNIAAAKSAKLCVAQVEELVECGELDPNFIHLPGVYVHCLVCVPHPFTKIEHLKLRDAGGVSPEQHESPKCRMARRAALEVEDGMVVNLGVGTPTLASSYIPESRDVVVMAGNGLMGIGRFPLNQEEVDPDVLNASKQTVTVNRAVGPCFLDFVDAMGITRGGHVDLALLGAMEVAENGDLANWIVPGKHVSGMGGGMELVQNSCRVVVLTHHTNKDGTPKIVKRCQAPLTAKGVVHRIITELAVFDVVKSKISPDLDHLLLVELAAGVSEDHVREKTGAPFLVSPLLKTIPLAPVLDETHGQ